MAERVKTQFLDLKTEDFGPNKQEDAGARVSGLGRPPPTELIEIPERVRKNEEVLAELDLTQSTFDEKKRRWIKTAKDLGATAWTSALQLAAQAVRAIREAAGIRPTIGQTITLEHDVPLQLRAEEGAPEMVKLISGASIVIYPEIDAPAGWVAARAPSGELGYVAAERVLS